MLHAQNENEGSHTPEFTNTEIKSVIEELSSTNTKANRLSTEVTLNILKLEKVPEIRVPKDIRASWASLSYEEHCKAANKYRKERTQYLKLEERVARVVEGNLNHAKSMRPTMKNAPFPSAGTSDRYVVGGTSKSAPAGRDSARRSTKNVWEGRASTRNIWSDSEIGDQLQTHNEDGEKLWRNSMAPNDGYESNKMPEYRRDGRRHRVSHRISNERVSFLFIMLF